MSQLTFTGEVAYNVEADRVTGSRPFKVTKTGSQYKFQGEPSVSIGGNNCFGNFGSFSIGTVDRCSYSGITTIIGDGQVVINGVRYVPETQPSPAPTVPSEYKTEYRWPELLDNVNSVSVSGASHAAFKTNPVSEGGNLRVSVTGASTLTMQLEDALSQLMAQVSGASVLRLSGRVQSLMLQVSGSSTIHSGLHAINMSNVSASGASNTRYSCDPGCMKSNSESGASRVICGN